MQKFLTDDNQERFQKAMDLYLGEDWKVVPGTLVVTMAAAPSGSDTRYAASFRTQFSVVLSNCKETA